MIGRSRAGALLPPALLAALVCLSGCAKTGMPGGGPKDTEPPTVVSTSPADGTAAVPRESAVAIRFSEEMDRASLERAVSVDPSTALTRFEWDGPVVTARPESLLPDSTTIVVTVGDGARDYHGVAMQQPFSFAFSTGPAVAAGVISGTVTLDGNPVAGAVVWACPGPVVADTAGTVTPCGDATLTKEDGRFLFRGIRTQERRYSLVAFLDSDGNGAFDTSVETGWIASFAALIDAPGDSVGGADLEIVAPAASRAR
jgi:hypothetical protein